MAGRRAVVVAPEFVRVARQLPAKMEKRVYDGAVAAGARVIRKEALTNLKSVLSGAKNADIIVRKQRKSRVGAKASVSVGLNRERWWLTFIEHGRQELVAKGKAIPMHMEDGTVVFTKHAKAVPARPFFRPAWDAKRDEAVKVMSAALLRGLERETKKLVGPFSKTGLGRRRR